MPRAIFTPLAESDLRAIYRFIARENHSPRAADRLIKSIRSKCDLYAGQPELCEPRHDLGPELRVCIVGSYVVIYQPIAGGFEVIRVVHGSRDYPSLFP